MKKRKVKQNLILGIGNILHKDDGVGVHVVNEIAETISDLPDYVEVFEGGTFGYDLLPVMSGRKKIVIIDALKINDEPGSVYRFPASHLTDCNNKFSLHDIGVKKIINMLMLMGESPEIEIIGIVPEDISSFDIGISDSVKKSIPKAVECILEAAV
ncbi:MAG TPA: HyaD/HybD family hydrogenase maturation endopeptidase [Spirochaetota bacterium]|nr:HyaD/HybD family hydrogenase maturation endopeptidase [Spirochaetota bacterium]HPF04565.1 HyaD/HybD family hydrogenase maturation endopeptidase [Spirochaetota bacterium]HPJ41998.1 HyaD/HybD family hydrogenase maturation endopeptidase [Spirochaetota bacterium]HPR37676.1 HyaD/HybD family hydrogenase maturation endopeptidase [Spirochaetota bacterium]HRX46090.1 HyaD/HybD family hydrogenase maturation endopeptidase [Spirochaetota bacterium]